MHFSQTTVIFNQQGKLFPVLVFKLVWQEAGMLLRVLALGAGNFLFFLFGRRTRQL
jgi:hypothetical protein